MSAEGIVESGNFIFTPTSIEGVVVIDVRRFVDERGFFMETYRRDDFVAGGIDTVFMQDNHSASRRGVLRGLHFQVEYPQAKLVRVVAGEVFDVAVDLRQGSPTFGKWEGCVLSAENARQFFIPRGFAHGYAVLSDHAEFCYKCDEIYHPHDEGGIMWNDPDLAIDWPLAPTEVILSAKDAAHPSFADYCSRL